MALVGTSCQAWFLHARAWREWSLGHRSEAVSLLDLSLGIQGSTVYDFRLKNGKPVLPRQFAVVPLPLPPDPVRLEPQLNLWLNDPETVGRLTKASVERLFPYLRPALASCIAPRERLAPTPRSGQGSSAGWIAFMERCINEANRLREVIGQLRELHGAHPPTLAITAAYAYYLMLDSQYETALRVLERDLHLSPEEGVLASLRVIALFRTSRRYQALEAANALIRDGSEGLIMVTLGMLALEEGQPAVACRYLYEALISPPDFHFAVALLQGVDRG